MNFVTKVLNAGGRIAPLIINNLVYKSIVSEPLKFNFNDQSGHIHISISKLQKILNEI